MLKAWDEAASHVKWRRRGEFYWTGLSKITFAVLNSSSNPPPPRPQQPPFSPGISATPLDEPQQRCTPARRGRPHSLPSGPSKSPHARQSAAMVITEQLRQRGHVQRGRRRQAGCRRALANVAHRRRCTNVLPAAAACSWKTAPRSTPVAMPTRPLLPWASSRCPVVAGAAARLLLLPLMLPLLPMPCAPYHTATLLRPACNPRPGSSPCLAHRRRRRPQRAIARRHPQHRRRHHLHGWRLACARPGFGRRDGADPGRQGDAVCQGSSPPTPPLSRRWQRGRQQAERVRCVYGECRITACLVQPGIDFCTHDWPAGRLQL